MGWLLWIQGPIYILCLSCTQVDFEELASKLIKMEDDCKASWDYLRAIAKHDSNTGLKGK